METARKTRIAMMATASVLAAAAAIGPAHAGEFDQAAYPAVVEAPAIAHGVVDHADEQKPMAAKKWALIAAAAGALAGLVKLIGAKKVMRAVGDTAGKAVKISAQAATGAVRAVGRAAASPLRFAALMAGLALFALTGVGFYDIEWIGGLVAGAAMMGLAAYGLMKTRRWLRPNPVKTASAELMVNRN